MYENHTWKALLTTFFVVLWGLAIYFNSIPLGLDLQGGKELIYQLRDPDAPTRIVSSKETDDTVEVLQKRIDTLGIKELSIRRLGIDKIVIQIPGATPAQTKKIESQIERSGRLQFKILVTEMGQVDRITRIKGVLSAKLVGSWDEKTAIHDIAELSDPDDPARAHSWTGPAGKHWVLLHHRTASGKAEYVDGNLLADASRQADSNNLPCVGFKWNSKGTKKFLKLTTTYVKKNLAVVLDGKLESAPTIRQAIGKNGIIEMYDNKKTLDENNSDINSLVVILKAGSLPAKPIKAYSKEIGAQLGNKAKNLGTISIGLALLLVVIFMAVYYHLRSGMVANIALGLNLFLIFGTLSMFGATLTLPGIAGILLTAGMAVDANILIFERIREETAKGAKLKVAVQTGYDKAFWTIFDANLTTALTALVLMWVGTGPIKGFGLTLTIGIVVSMFTALFVTRFIYGFLVAKEVITEIKFMQLFARPNIDFFAANKKAMLFSAALIIVGWLVFLARGEKSLGIDFTGGTVISMRFNRAMGKDEVTKRIKDHFRGQANTQIEVQRIGKSIGEKSYEWQVRTRRVESTSGVEPAPKSASLLDAIIPAAYGQDGGGDGGGDPAPVESGSQAPVESGAPAPVDSGSGAPGGPTAGGPSPPPDIPTVPAKAAADQEYFHGEIKKIFAADLVTAYPVEVTLLKAGPGQVRARFTANFVQKDDGNEDLITPDTLRTQLPGALNKMAGSLDQKKAKVRILKFKGMALAGGFTVEAPKDAAGKLIPPSEDGLTSLIVTTGVIAESGAEDYAELFKEGLEQAQRHGATFAVAVPFPNVDTVGAAVAKNLSSKALIATMACVVIICLYVWLRFDLWSGIAAIVAVFHDVLALLGFLAILDAILDMTGVAFDVKFNLTTISAFLTLVGYSINDTIVILDRIREDKADTKAKTYTAELVNGAINKTLSRTVLTSVTSFLVCLVLFFASFGGLQSIQGLSVALLFGIVVGTYSSMFVAAPILLHDKRKVSMILYSSFGLLIISLLISKGLVLPGLGVLGFMVVLPLVLGKIGAFQVADPAAAKAKGKAKAKK
ncbi:MAG: protein translocase subunit SecD [Planctomycetes bacterium]|nr:protein translocase subunit SecD [Planctomycetota bacterium]